LRKRACPEPLHYTGYTLAVAARALGVSYRSMRRLVRSGAVKSVLVPRSRLIEP
jgi:hypothetical protein